MHNIKQCNGAEIYIMKPTLFSTKTVVCIHVRSGNKKSKKSYDKSHDLLMRFHEFLKLSQIYSVPNCGGYASGDVYMAFFTPGDAARIIEWLAAHGAGHVVEG